MKKFSKEQNALKTKEGQEFAACHTLGPYSLNLYVLDFNHSSTEAVMKKAYYSMALRFHVDKNIGLDTSEMMKMINEAKFGLQEQLRTNDASREEERVQATEDVISTPSDHNSDSESSNTPSKQVSSSFKESILPAKHTNDNEETSLKKSHP